MVTGDNEVLIQKAEKLLQTYTLEEILEKNEISPEDLVLLLLEQGWIDTEMPCVL